MDARTYFLLLHEEAHWAGKARRIFSLPTPDQWRTALPGHNSIAWCVCHIAYGEDWGIAALRDDAAVPPQPLARLDMGEMMPWPRGFETRSKSP